MSDTWIQTFTGKKFHPLNPNPDELDIKDIAHSLSLIVRFVGHCFKAYTVGEHSLRASYLIPPDYALDALLHDSPEAYLGDLASPIKRDPSSFGVSYQDVENRLYSVIAKKFGLHDPVPETVKYADTVLLITEQRDLMVQSEPWSEIQPTRERIVPYDSHYEVEQKFLERFYELSEGR